MTPIETCKRKFKYLSCKDILNECIQVKQLGDFEVECFSPSNNNFKVGIIGPIGLEDSDEDFTEILNDSGYTNAKAKRLIKGYGRNAVKTKTMILYLKVDSLPEHIILMKERFKVTPFFEPPLQCFNCQDFGHGAKYCKKRTRCVICAEEHKHSECPNKNIFTKCSNCGGNHTSSYGGCEKMKDARDIKKLKINDNLSYRDAVLKFNNIKTNQNNVINSFVSNTQNKPSTTNSRTSSINNNSSFKIKNKALSISHVSKIDIASKTVEFSSPNASQINENCNIQPLALNETKFASCLLEILNCVNRADTLGKKCAMITKAFNTYLGTSLTQNSLLNEVKTGMQKITPSPVVSVSNKGKQNRKNGNK